MNIIKPSIMQLPGTIPVQFACTCGQLKPISRIYFCRHCLKLKCGFCLCHEIDSIYCPNCLENMPSQEARLKRNKCTNCFQCPSCDQTLSTRATTIQKSTGDEKPMPKKSFYLTCPTCHWTSRDVGIPDKLAASGSWPERENVYANRITAIQDMYKAVVFYEKHDKQDKSRKLYNQRGKYTTLTDKIGITAAIARKRAGLPEIPAPGMKPNIKQLEPATAKDDVPSLPDDIFTKAVNLDEITTISQRLIQPDWQPTTVDKMFPVPKSFIAKRSQRCRTCEHNVSKPEYNPTSIKFKIHLLACYHIPNVRLITVEPLRAGQQCEMIIKLSNPTQHPTNISFLPLPNVEEELEQIREQTERDLEIVDKRDEPKSISSRDSLFSSLTKQVSFPEDSRLVDTKANCEIELPSVSVFLSQRDDAAEYDDSSESSNVQDDPKIVLFRKFNKVVIRLKVKPNEDLKIGDDVIVGFTMQHTYINTITTLENKDPKKIDHRVKIYIQAGKLVGSN